MKALRVVIFVLIIPGTIVFYLPLFLGSKAFQNQNTNQFIQYFGILSWLIGGLVATWCVMAFFTVGKGSPAPHDPPTVLVTSGLYRWTRNPMYVGGLFIVLGHYLYLQSWILLAYLILVFLLFHSIVIFYEESHLRRQFGEAYEQYCKQVPRWIVRLG